MRKLLTALVAAASIGAAAIATSSSAEAWRGGWGWGPGAVVGEVLPVLSSGARSRRGRIITRMATTDTDQIPITDRPAAACGTATPGCQLASYELT